MDYYELLPADWTGCLGWDEHWLMAVVVGEVDSSWQRWRKIIRLACSLAPSLPHSFYLHYFSLSPQFRLLLLLNYNSAQQCFALLLPNSVPSIGAKLMDGRAFVGLDGGFP
jgi:hypothetical protein